MSSYNTEDLKYIPVQVSAQEILELFVGKGAVGIREGGQTWWPSFHLLLPEQ